MQMRVLRLGVVGIKVRQTHILHHTPLTGTCLYITIINVIQGMLLYVLIELYCIVECFMITRSTRILTESVDGKTNSIELLLRIFRLSLIVQTPEDTTIFMVDKMTDEVFFRPCSSLQILLFTQYTVGSRERPEDPCIKDSPLVSLLDELSTSGHLTVETAVLIILHLIKPETQDVVFQHILHLHFHGCYNMRVSFLIPYHFLIG